MFSILMKVGQVNLRFDGVSTLLFPFLNLLTKSVVLIFVSVCFFFTESVIWGVFNRRFSLLGSGLLLEEGRNIVGSSVSGTFSMKLPCLEKSTVCNLGQ